ncbi:DNA internalization-related competence protein ComEC/Rec2 [Maridesulfovibrio zosterae]|uniref:DNA internalization-related competence protein ComEC/Rec2 n=1 Tax=Maridesulfovibrio zosterae TaxID=82171 RepID=UPI00041FADFD|nr:DNA internalization-related competence protein ComEC/Rec2 [Maridesulfovibrio zosterae]
MNSPDDYSVITDRPVLAGLFLWQKLIPAFVLGLLSIKWMLPAFIAFLLYIFILIIFRLEKGTIVLLVFLFGIGNWYAGYSMPERSVAMPEWMSERKKVDFSGEIESVRGVPGNRYKILLKNVVCNSTSGLMQLNGYLNWTWDKPDRTPFVGQKVFLYGRIKPVHGFKNDGLWDYDFYNLTKNIFYRTYSRGPLKGVGLRHYQPDSLQKIRTSLLTHILQNAPPTQGGAMFPALLTGDRFYLSNDTVEFIRRAGVSHVLALSGLHVGFIVSIGFGLAWLIGLFAPSIYLKIPRLKLGVLFSIPPVLFYLWLGQFTPSLLRATCMFGFWGILLLMDRGRVLLDGLFLAVGIILVFAPLSIFDLGFQLSVLAVAGIALFYPLFRGLLPHGRNFVIKLFKFLLGILYVSLCANIFLLPVLVWNFGVLTPNLLFNVIFIPLLGIFIMPVCGMGGLVTSYVSPYFSKILFGAGASCFEGLISIVRLTLEAGCLLEYAFYRPLWEDLLVYYLIVGLIFFIINRKIKVAVFFILPILVLICVRVYGQAETNGVRLDLLDTGQSQCIVVTGPQGSRTVVDGGGGFGNSFDMGRSIVGPWLCSGHLPRVDNIFMTHGDRDHAGGLAFLLEKFSVGNFYSNGDIPSGKIGERFKNAFLENDIKPQELSCGDIVELEDGLVMEVLHPSKNFKGSKNDRSLYLRLLWNGKPLATIAGDLGKRGLDSLLASGMDLSSDVLILPHHGSAGSFSTDLYSEVNPRIALAACGFLNRFNFVSKKVQSELAHRKIKLYTTSNNGHIFNIWFDNNSFRMNKNDRKYFIFSLN